MWRFSSCRDAPYRTRRWPRFARPRHQQDCYNGSARAPRRSLAADFARGKTLGARRRGLEASLPANLRYVAGWSQHVPTLEEAAIIADIRRQILAMHDLTTPFATAAAVRDRIAELHEAGRLKDAA